MLKKLLLCLIVVLIVFAVVVAMQPNEFRISRSLVIAESPKNLFAEVNDLHRMEAWSPWAKLDPHAITRFDGPSAGQGASMQWTGNREVGEGKMTITESRPNELVRMQLDFYKPMQTTNTGEFTFTPEGGQTKVTWSMYGKNDFLGKAVGLIFNCEKMVGEQFEKGLQNLKTLVEGK